jgi:hypothetical protein
MVEKLGERLVFRQLYTRTSSCSGHEIHLGGGKLLALNSADKDLNHWFKVGTINYQI